MQNHGHSNDRDARNHRKIRVKLTHGMKGDESENTEENPGIAVTRRDTVQFGWRR